MDPVLVFVGALVLGASARVGKHFYDRRRARRNASLDALRQQAVETNAVIWTATQKPPTEADLAKIHIKWCDVELPDHIKFDILTGQDRPEPVVTLDSVTTPTETPAAFVKTVPDLSYNRMWLLRENRRSHGEIDWEKDFFRPKEDSYRLRLLPAPPMRGLRTTTNFIDTDRKFSEHT